MRILIIILSFLALLAALVSVAVLNQLVLAMALLVIGSVALLGALLGRKAVAYSLIFFCTALIISLAGSAFYQTRGFARERHGIGSSRRRTRRCVMVARATPRRSTGTRRQ